MPACVAETQCLRGICEYDPLQQQHSACSAEATTCAANTLPVQQKQCLCNQYSACTIESQGPCSKCGACAANTMPSSVPTHDVLLLMQRNHKLSSHLLSSPHHVAEVRRPSRCALATCADSVEARAVQRGSLFFESLNKIRLHGPTGLRSFAARPARCIK